MKHMKTVEVPKKTQQVVDFVSCDLCKEKICVASYDVDEVEIFHKVGSEYPEGGSGQKKIVDMCGNCFDEKLVPWLLTQGVEPKIEDWEW